jgi:hypothetical protein
VCVASHEAAIICHGIVGCAEALSFGSAGTTLVDHNEDGRFDVLYGNWNGPHRLFIQNADGTFTDNGQARDSASVTLSRMST